MPRFLIYDFCCGLFITAIHCLWWAISHVSVVCDTFHSKNHSCSPGYNPKVHKSLNFTNTVSHEQRNRAIQMLGQSLRNCKRNLYVSLLGYQTIVLNIRAQEKGTQMYENRAKGLFDYDVEWCFFDCLELTCYSCQSYLTVECIPCSFLRTPARIVGFCGVLWEKKSQNGAHVINWKPLKKVFLNIVKPTSA